MLLSAFDQTRLPSDAERLMTILQMEDWDSLTVASELTSVFVKGDAAIRINESNDVGFANYAAMCLHSPSPHFVQVGWHSFLKDGTHVTLMEKLEPCPSDRDAPRSIRPNLRAVWRLANNLDPYDEWDMKDIGSPAIMPLQAPSNDPAYIKTLMEDIEGQSPSLAAAINLLQGHLLILGENDRNYFKLPLDLTPTNIMLRKDKETDQATIVLNDPYAFFVANSDERAYVRRESEILKAVFKKPDPVDLPPQTFTRAYH